MQSQPSKVSTVKPRPVVRLIYQEQHIWPATLFGGPLAAGYLIAGNHKTLGETRKAIYTWIAAITCTLLVVGIPAYFNLWNHMYLYTLPLFYTCAAAAYVHFFQAGAIKAYIQKGGKAFNGGRVFAITLTGLVIIAAAGIGLVSFLDNVVASGIRKRYCGKLRNEIIYESSVSGSETDDIIRALRRTGFIDEQQVKSVYLRKLGDSFEISIPSYPSIAHNQEAIAFFMQWRSDLQNSFPHNRIIVNLTLSSDIHTSLKRLE